MKHLTADHPAEIIATLNMALKFDRQPAASLNGWSDRLRHRLSSLLHLEAISDWAGSGDITAEPAGRELCDGYIREKAYIDAGPLGPIPVYVLTPDPLPAPAPAILCLHGHGGYHAGKVMTACETDTHPIAIECGEALNYGYGEQMAKAGYVAICPDAYGFGERMREADLWTTEHLCDTYQELAKQIGHTHLGLTTWSNQRVLDYAATLPQVRGNTFGCIGLSYGGVQALTVAGVEQRIGATVISGSLSNIAESEGPGCGAVDVPGMLAWFDRTDIAISVAPRPLMFEFMRQDSCLEFDKAWNCFEYVKAGYESLGAGDRITVDLADTDHRYIGNEVPSFFNKWLPVA